MASTGSTRACPATREPVMVSEQYVATEPTRIIPFGYVEQTRAGAMLVVNDRPGIEPNRFTLDSHTEQYLTSLEVWRIHQGIPEEVWTSISALQQHGILVAWPVWFGLNVIPVLRDAVVLVSTPANGFHTLHTSAGDVMVTEIGNRLLHLIDGERTLDSLVDEISNSLTDAPRAFLEADALWFIQTMRKARSITLEPAW